MLLSGLTTMRDSVCSVAMAGSSASIPGVSRANVSATPASCSERVHSGRYLVDQSAFGQQPVGQPVFGEHRSISPSFGEQRRPVRPGCGVAWRRSSAVRRSSAAGWGQQDRPPRRASIRSIGPLGAMASQRIRRPRLASRLARAIVIDSLGMLAIEVDLACAAGITQRLFGHVNRRAGHVQTGVGGGEPCLCGPGSQYPRVVGRGSFCGVFTAPWIERQRSKLI